MDGLPFRLDEHRMELWGLCLSEYFSNEVA